MSENDKKYCSNCCQNIEASKFFLHERMCSVNVKKCPKCNKPFTVEDLEEHINEVHCEGECEFCKKKFPKIELEKHKRKCDHKMVPCAFCELEVLLGEIKEHQKTCGAITEPCPQCGRYIQRKDLDNHLLQGCPPPKNDRRSVDVFHNNNSKLSLDNNKKNKTNIYNNYYPINDFIPDEVFIEDKIDIKTHANNKPNLQIRPASGKKILNENVKKNMNILGYNYNNKELNNINIINNKKEKNNIIKNKNINDKDNNNVKTGKTSLNNKNNNNKMNNYMNKQNNNNKGPVTLIPTKNNNNIISSRYPNNKKTTVKKSNKPAFATSLSKTSLNSNVKSSRDKKDKTSDEEFRKSREKFTFQNAKELEKIHLNKEVKKIPKLNNNKGIIKDEDYVENFNFGDVDDQLMQQVIEQSLKDQTKKIKK